MQGCALKGAKSIAIAAGHFYTIPVDGHARKSQFWELCGVLPAFQDITCAANCCVHFCVL